MSPSFKRFVRSTLVWLYCTLVLIVVLPLVFVRHVWTFAGELEADYSRWWFKMMKDDK